MALTLDKDELIVLDTLLEASHILGFWMEVTPDAQFIFRNFNDLYKTDVGFETDGLIDKTPQASLPERQAETVLANYEKCRSTGLPHVYEELLELGHGSTWWKTTLSPVKNVDGEVIAILGQAIDISSAKAREFEAAALQSRLSSMNEELRMFASLAVQDMRAPFMTISGLVNFLSDGFVDLGDGKKEMLDYCAHVSAKGMAQMETIMTRAQSLSPIADEISNVDLNHLCADLVAIVDPDKRFDIGFPDNELRTDKVALQLILRTMIENAMRHCEKRIEITVFDDSEGRLLFTIFDDGGCDAAGRRADGSNLVPEPGDGAGYMGLELVRDLVSERGGTLEARKTDVRLGVELCFSLPGAIEGWNRPKPLQSNQNLIDIGENTLQRAI